jgi:hypothetical protein
LENSTLTKAKSKLFSPLAYLLTLSCIDILFI